MKDKKVLIVIAVIIVAAVALMIGGGMVPTSTTTTTTMPTATTTTQPVTTTTVPANTSVSGECDAICLADGYTKGTCRLSCLSYEHRASSLGECSDPYKCCCD